MSNFSSPDGLQHEARTKTQEPTLLSFEAEAGGLAYVVEAAVPQDPESFTLVVKMPEAQWLAVATDVNAIAEQNSWFAMQYRKVQSHKLGDGNVGSVFIGRASPSKDNAPAISIKRIQSNNFYLPEGNSYYEAKGVGSLVLDSICAVADSKGWRIYLEPLERDGRLMGEDLNDWYARRGFLFGYELDDDIPTRRMMRDAMRSTSGSMMRQPQQPDPASKVHALLQS